MRDRTEWLDTANFRRQLSNIKGTLEWTDNELGQLLGVHRFTLSRWRKTGSPADFQAHLVTSLEKRLPDWTSGQKDRALTCLRCYGPGEALAVLFKREF